MPTILYASLAANALGILALLFVAARNRVLREERDDARHEVAELKKEVAAITTSRDINAKLVEQLAAQNAKLVAQLEPLQDAEAKRIRQREAALEKARIANAARVAAKPNGKTARTAAH